MRNSFLKRRVQRFILSQNYTMSLWFCNHPSLVQMSCFIYGRRRMAFTRHRMICLVLVHALQYCYIFGELINKHTFIKTVPTAHIPLMTSANQVRVHFPGTGMKKKKQIEFINLSFLQDNISIQKQLTKTLNPTVGFIKRKTSFFHQSLLCARGVYTFLYGDYATRYTCFRCA